ncbi:MAG: hypothetical protein ACUVXG_14785 [Anaerolineae bacterium]
MLQLKTQTAEFWLEKFQVGDEDAEYLRDHVLDLGRPQTTDELGQALVAWRCEQEEAKIRAELSRGTVYQPRQKYKVGEELLFTALDFATGTVKGVREGNNPEYGPFQVIQVEFPGQKEPREFASGLQAPHKLNWDNGEGPFLADLKAPSTLYEAYGHRVSQAMEKWLRDPASGFVRLGDQWVLKDMLAEVHLGHLNIAEAFLEVQGAPATAAEILPSLELPEGIAPDIRLLSVEHALRQDERFVDVGTAQESRWYLKRLMPAGAVEPPPRFLTEVPTCDRSVLPGELLALELEIDDENGLAEVLGAVNLGFLDQATITLNYLHWRLGTLPLTKKTRPLFPHGTTQRTMVRLVDERSGDEMPAWVVHEHKYVFGLEEWYRQHEIPVGALITLKRTEDPLALIVSYQPRRMKRLWVRVAQVEGGRLTFSMLKQPIACDYDDLMTIWAADPQAVDKVWAAYEERGTPLSELVREIFPELAKLSPEGTVHAKTLYSAINLVRRCPPGPLFVELVTNPAFRDTGNGFWTFERAD